MKLSVAVVILVTASVAFADDVVWEIAPPWSLVPGSSVPEGSKTTKERVVPDNPIKAKTQSADGRTENKPTIYAQQDTQSHQDASQKS